jgi:hypothetical protein
MALTNKQRTDAIDALEEAVVTGLAQRLKSEDATASDFKLAWDICKDVGVLSNFHRHPATRDLLEELPTLPDLEQVG